MGHKVSVSSNNLNNNVQQVSDDSPCLSTASKCTLSNISVPTRYDGKKTKTFTLPNRFAVFTSSDTNDSVFIAAANTHNDVVNLLHYELKIVQQSSPTCIRGIINFLVFKDVLNKTTTD